MNRTGCQCIGSLFMRKYMNTLVTCSDCVNMLRHGFEGRKRGDKKTLFADWTLNNCVYFREPIIISAKNNENAIFIINICPPEVYAKSSVINFLLKYSSMSMTFYRKVAKITRVN